MKKQRKRRIIKGHQCRDETWIKVSTQIVAMKWGNARRAKCLTGGQPSKKKH